MVFDVDLIRKVFAIEGQYPQRPGLKYLQKYRESRPDIYSNLGLFFESGPTWKQIRSGTQKHMLKTPAIRIYLSAMEKVSRDFVNRISVIRNSNFEVDNLLNELFKWSLESVGVVALNRRIGCLEPNLSPDSEPQKLIDAVQTTFRAVHLMEMATGIDRFFPGKLYKKIVEAQDYFAMVVHKYLNQVVEEMKSRGDKVETELNLLETFIASKELDIKQIAVVTLDMFFAGIDTTAMATGFLLYQLAANPEKQDRLLQEIKEILPNKDTSITTDKLEAMTYLRACVRESMRLTPIVVGTARITPTDAVLGGYHIPAGTVMALVGVLLSRQESVFPQPLKFLPERWLRPQDAAASKERELAGFPANYEAQPFGSIPFGHGPRMCIGRRIAEQELQLATIKIVQKFRLEYHQPEKIDIEISFINRPTAPLKISFIDRN